jgi:hypothetical protein
MLKSDKIDAKKLPIEKPNQASIAYTAVEPEDLPPAVVELTKVPGLTALEVGACYGATESYPGGVYWFALIH